MWIGEILEAIFYISLGVPFNVICCIGVLRLVGGWRGMLPPQVALPGAGIAGLSPEATVASFAWQVVIVEFLCWSTISNRVATLPSPWHLFLLSSTISFSCPSVPLLSFFRCCSFSHSPHKQPSGLVYSFESKSTGTIHFLVAWATFSIASANWAIIAMFWKRCT